MLFASAYVARRSAGCGTRHEKAVSDMTNWSRQEADAAVRVASGRWWVVPVKGAGVDGEGSTSTCGVWALNECRNQLLPVDEKLVLLVLGLEYPNGCDDPERLAGMVGLFGPQVIDALHRLTTRGLLIAHPTPAPWR